MYEKPHAVYHPRVRLTEGMLKRFFKNIYMGKVSELSLDRGLSYTLVYNLVHGRIQSLSTRDFKIIFGEDPPFQKTGRVDGKYFRGMVKLWLYLNSGISEADLYKEFYPQKKFKRVDYRIFSGGVKTVPVRLEQVMEQKFFDEGFGGHEIKQYIKEYESIDYNTRIFYDDIKPVLDYVEKHLKVHPGRILNQFSARYESGELITVSKAVYDHALRLKKKTSGILESGSKSGIEKLREEIYGKRTGFTLFSEVEGELEFLQTYGGRNPKHYLGRNISLYKKSKLKRIATWRAKKIRNVCHRLLRDKPELSISTIPQFFLNKIFINLISILTTRMVSILVEDKSGKFERSVLEPVFHQRGDYGREKQKTTSMDDAAHVLGMSRKAFDLMVANHRDIFRRIGIYEKSWRVPHRYLDDISINEGFPIIKAKYEFLAKNDKRDLRPIRKNDPSGHVTHATPSRQIMSRGHRDAPEPQIHRRNSDASLLESPSFGH